MKSSEQKEIEWKEKRRGKITASTLPDLMKAGKGCPFGKAALDAMYLVRYERRTGTMRENGSNKAFDWGHENEPLAVEWVRSQLMNEIKSCTTDFKDIVFNEPFEGFGDSPDFYVYGFDGKVIALGEIKCPMSQGKIESLQFGNTIDEKDEYYWQFLGHFLGRPDVDKLYYVIYDGYTNEGRILEMNRANHADNIKKLYDRIRLASEMIDESIRSGLDLLDCVDKAKEVLKLKMQIEAGWLVALLLRWYEQGLVGVGAGVCCVLLGTAALLPMFCIRGMGAGDIKLLSVIAGMYGMKFWVHTGIVFAVLAAVASLLHMLGKRQFLERMKYFVCCAVLHRRKTYYDVKRDGYEMVIPLAPLAAMAYYIVCLERTGGIF